MSYGRHQYTGYGPSVIGSLISMFLVIFLLICAGTAPYLIYAGLTAVDELNAQEQASQVCHDICTPYPGKVVDERCFCIISGEYVAP